MSEQDKLWSNTLNTKSLVVHFHCYFRPTATTVIRRPISEVHLAYLQQYIFELKRRNPVNSIIKEYDIYSNAHHGQIEDGSLTFQMKGHHVIGQCAGAHGKVFQLYSMQSLALG